MSDTQSQPAVKICGLKDPETLQAAITAGARYVGFVFYPRSPRHIEIDIAHTLSLKIPTGIRSVGLFVDPDDETLTQILSRIPLDMIQLHGEEVPERITEIKNKHNVQIIKAIRIANEDDLDQIKQFEPIADMLLCDAKPPGADLPGGTGQTFDWNLLEDKTFTKPWMLSGGLTKDNVKQALETLKPNALDVSSGVESSKGIKDAAKIKDFIDAVKNYDQA